MNDFDGLSEAQKRAVTAAVEAAKEAAINAVRGSQIGTGEAVGDVSAVDEIGEFDDEFVDIGDIDDVDDIDEFDNVEDYLPEFSIGSKLKDIIENNVVHVEVDNIKDPEGKYVLLKEYRAAMPVLNVLQGDDYAQFALTPKLAKTLKEYLDIVNEVYAGDDPNEEKLSWYESLAVWAVNHKVKASIVVFFNLVIIVSAFLGFVKM